MEEKAKKQPKKLIHKAPFTKFTNAAVVHDVVDLRSVYSRSLMVRYMQVRNQWVYFNPAVVKIKAHLVHLNPGVSAVFPWLVGAGLAYTLWLCLYRTHRVYIRTRDPYEYHERRPYTSKLVRYWSSRF